LDGLATVRAEALVEHYQKTREQLTRGCLDRNHRNFLFFLDVVTALLTARMFWGYVVLRVPSEAAVREAIAKSFRQS
jgi:hypothetical protein